MNIRTIEGTIKYKDTHAVLKALLYIKLVEHDIVLSDNVVNILVSFSYTSAKKDVIQNALNKGWVQSWQSGENCVSRLVKKNLLVKKNKRRVVNTEFLPYITEPFVAAILKLHNYDSY